MYATWGDGGGGIDGAYVDPRLVGLGWRFTRPICRAAARCGAGCGLPRAPHRAWRAGGGARLRAGRYVPARGLFRRAGRRGVRQGLLYRPGGGVAHAASRHGAEALRAGERRRRHCRRREPRSRPGQRSIGSMGSSVGEQAWRWCAWTGRRRRWRRHADRGRRACVVAQRSSLGVLKLSGVQSRPVMGRALSVGRDRRFRICALSRRGVGRAEDGRPGAVRESWCWKAFRPACRGSPSCASARTSAKPFTPSIRSGSRATVPRTLRGSMARRGHRAQQAQDRGDHRQRQGVPEARRANVVRGLPVGRARRQAAHQHIQQLEGGACGNRGLQAAVKSAQEEGFRFVGPTTMYAFMQASGMVNDHLVSCPRHAPCAKLQRALRLPAS